MAKKTPMQRVKEEYGSKEALAEKVLGVLDRPEDEEAVAAFENNVKTMSNRKLLRLWDAHQLMTSKFGTKAKLVDAITNARFKGGNEDYARKLGTFTLPRLLDVARQHNLIKISELPRL
ncbi:hypothetical protein DL240_10350 [Lujinxingia litoralis]|uniref:Uncharacterized protein n=1 Tax=Lujinxingia litoralis TaxID=2211119 RepID=A0A328C8J2_9DELT|nr:hypothetical protein [Lujinxingia litoralis]RAL22245.1 hypothetical protein DL240_10350 [Lujinxingia litoralis]